MRLGILQGRLSPPNGGFQEFPKDWKEEFELALDLGLKHIDWLVTKNCTHESNALFSGLPIVRSNKLGISIGRLP